MFFQNPFFLSHFISHLKDNIATLGYCVYYYVGDYASQNVKTFIIRYSHMKWKYTHSLQMTFSPPTLRSSVFFFSHALCFCARVCVFSAKTYLNISTMRQKNISVFYHTLNFHFTKRFNICWFQFIEVRLNLICQLCERYSTFFVVAAAAAW